MEILFQAITENGVDKAFDRYEALQISQYDYTQLAKNLHQEGYTLESISVLKRALKIHPGNPYLVKSIIPKIYQIILKPFYNKEGCSELAYMATMGYIDAILPKDLKNDYFYIYEKHVEYLSSKTPAEKEAALNYLEVFDENQLNRQVYMKDGKSFPSQYEKWLKRKADLQFDLRQFEACIKTVTSATLSQWHNKNDIWLKRLKARSLCELKHFKEAITIYKELLLKHPTWFMYHELSRIYLSTNQKEEAIVVGAKGCLGKDADPSKCLNLYLTMYDLLQTVDEKNYEAFLHFVFYIKTRKENQYPIQREMNTKYERLLLQYKEPMNLKKALCKYWEDIVYSKAEKQVGTIKTILPNGKAGFIQYGSGKQIYFKMSNVKFSRKHAKEGKAVSFIIEDSFDMAKNKPSKIATCICEMKVGARK